MSETIMTDAVISERLEDMEARGYPSEEVHSFMMALAKYCQGDVPESAVHQLTDNIEDSGLLDSLVTELLLSLGVSSHRPQNYAGTDAPAVQLRLEELGIRYTRSLEGIRLDLNDEILTDEPWRDHDRPGGKEVTPAVAAVRGLGASADENKGTVGHSILLAVEAQVKAWVLGEVL